MKADYKIEGKTSKVEVQVEEKVAQVLQLMAGYSKFSISELANTALKRFISQHKDFLPPEAREKVFR